MPPLSKEKPGGCDLRRAAASSLAIGLLGTDISTLRDFLDEPL